MAKSQRLGDGEIRSAFRLLSDLREMRHDRPAMHRHLVETLGRLVDATGGFAADIAGWRPGGTPAIRSFTLATDGADVVLRARGPLDANQNPFDDPTFYYGIRRVDAVDAISYHDLIGPHGSEGFPAMLEVKSETQHVDHLIAWHQKGPPVDGMPAGEIFGVSLTRFGRGARRYSAREAAFARLLFEELNWLHATGRLDPPGPDRSGLPPRLREVLDLLLAGVPPKQIAQRLGLSIHTVREHVRRLYDRFEVEGRDELMARFVR